jgi:hypothetical protein
MPWRSKHPLLNCHTRRAPLAEITYKGLPVFNANMETTKGMKQIIQHTGQ